VSLRPVRRDDEQFADAFFRWLSEETKYLRFMYQVKELTPAILEGVLHQDGLRRVVLVVEPIERSAADPTPAVAIGRYAPTSDPGECEVAITVGDPWQGRGVGRALLKRLIALARRGGYQTMSATALTANAKMVGLARAFGFEIRTRSGGETTMRKVLRPIPASPPAIQ
ncbi:MAG: GNAT family N-acetyltransferase, partial [Betaproteobacteria bacterium]